MNPKIWGPPLWFSLHTITLHYPEKPSLYDKKAMSDFFTNLQYVLPCKTCSQRYDHYLTKHPIQNYLNSRNDLVRWLIKIHNEVNEHIGYQRIDEDQAFQKLNAIYNKPPLTRRIKKFIQHYTIHILGGILLLLSLTFFYKKIQPSKRFKKTATVNLKGGTYANYYRNYH